MMAASERALSASLDMSFIWLSAQKAYTMHHRFRTSPCHRSALGYSLLVKACCPAKLPSMRHDVPEADIKSTLSSCFPRSVDAAATYSNFSADL